VHRKYIPKYIEQDATLHSLFISGNCSTCFGWYFDPSSGAHTTASTASGICRTVTVICRYRGRVGTGLSVLWVAYATHITVSTTVSTSNLVNMKIIFNCLRGYNTRYLTLGKQQVLEIGLGQNTVN
jgi:hypothetical protein